MSMAMAMAMAKTVMVAGKEAGLKEDVLSASYFCFLNLYC
jgi:hypothetical protein